MDKLDEMIGRAMTEEDRALLASHGQRGYVAEALGVFTGPMAGTMRLVYVVVLVTFVAAVYALWRLGSASEAVSAVQWGVAAVVLFQMMALSKSYMGSHLEANRMLRELKRLELQLALLRGGNPG